MFWLKWLVSPAPKVFVDLGRKLVPLSCGKAQHSHQSVDSAFALGHPVETLAALEDAQSARLKLHVPGAQGRILLLTVLNYFRHDVETLGCFTTIFILKRVPQLK